MLAAGMGMGVQYAVNFSSVPKNNCKTATVATNSAESWILSEDKIVKNKGVGFHRLQEQMDGLLEDYSRESIRNTMLKQEQIFKEQVRELHRLYKVQKTLMAELNKDLRFQSITSATAALSDTTRSEFWSSTSTSLNSRSPSCRDKPNSVALLNSDNNFHQVFNNMAGPSSWGISATSVETFGTPKGKQSAREDSATRVGDTQLQSLLFKGQLNDRIGVENLQSFSDEDADLELSLRIGSSSSSKNTRQKCLSTMELRSSMSAYEGIRTFAMPNFNRSQHAECSEANANYDVEGLQQPPWLSQAFSLNKT